MSHDHGRRAACSMTIWSLRFHFEIHEAARGVTAMVVGSGDLFGLFFVALSGQDRIYTLPLQLSNGADSPSEQQGVALAMHAKT